MIDISSISAGLKLGDDGIWYARDRQDVSYPEEGNDVCFAVEDESFWFRHRNVCITTIAKAYPPTNDGAIYDIGGGNGVVSLALQSAGFSVVLLEPGPAGAANAKQRGLSHVICATTDTANLAPGSLPAVGLFDVIEHVEDDMAFLQSIKYLLEQGGRLYATVPAYSFLWSEEDIIAGHFRRYTLKEITNLLESAGLQVEFASYIFRPLPPPILLFRTLPFRLGLTGGEQQANRASRDHVRNDGLFNRILDSVLRREISKLKANKTMRFGGSCLVVANCP